MLQALLFQEAFLDFVIQIPPASVSAFPPGAQGMTEAVNPVLWWDVSSHSWSVKGRGSLTPVPGLASKASARRGHGLPGYLLRGRAGKSCPLAD